MIQMNGNMSETIPSKIPYAVIRKLWEFSELDTKDYDLYVQHGLEPTSEFVIDVCNCKQCKEMASHFENFERFLGVKLRTTYNPSWGLCFFCDSREVSTKASLRLIHILSAIMEVPDKLFDFAPNKYMPINAKTLLTHQTPLTVAFNSKRFANVEKLLRQGADIPEDSFVVHVPSGVHNVISFTITYCLDVDLRHRIVKQLIEKNVNLDVHGPTQPLDDFFSYNVSIGGYSISGLSTNIRANTATPLMTAVWFKDFQSAQMLLNAGADANLTFGGMSPLGLFCNQGGDLRSKDKKDTLSLLIKCGANCKDCYVIPTHIRAVFFAVLQDMTTLLEVFLESGEDANACQDELEEGRPVSLNLLSYATHMNNYKAVEVILKYKPDIEWKDSTAYAPIHIAAWSGFLEILHMLLQHGAKHDERTQDGNTPLSLACHGHHPEAVDKLLALPCNVNNQDKDDDTPLLFAVFHGSFEICKKLIAKGADANCKNVADTTPVWYAAYRCNKDILKLLLQYNVDLDTRSIGINQMENDEENIDWVQIYDNAVSPVIVSVISDQQNSFDIAKIFFLAGSQEKELYNQQLASDLVCMTGDEKETANELGLLLSRPRSLLVLSRMAIRRTIGYQKDFKKVVDELEVPVTLKPLLCLSDIIDDKEEI